MIDQAHWGNIDWIAENAKTIHYFGLGFIQVKIDKNWRIHYYTSDLPKTSEIEEVHNHRYNFTSQICKGEFVQKYYERIKGDDYLIKKEDCQEKKPALEDEVEILDFNMRPCPTGLQLFTETYHSVIGGNKYFMDHNTFHTMECKGNGYGITFLFRGDYQKEYADIIYKKDKDLTCPFSIKMSRDQLLTHIEKIINC